MSTPFAEHTPTHDHTGGGDGGRPTALFTYSGVVSLSSLCLIASTTVDVDGRACGAVKGRAALANQVWLTFRAAARWDARAAARCDAVRAAAGWDAWAAVPHQLSTVSMSVLVLLSLGARVCGVSM